MALDRDPEGDAMQDRFEQSGLREIWRDPEIQELMARSLRSPGMRRSLRRVRRGYRYYPPAPVKTTRKKRGWR